MTALDALRKARLYGILDLGYLAREDAGAMAERMIRGGVQVVQVRGKGRTDAVILEVARAVRAACEEGGVPLILNDHPHLVAEAGAAGCHVGQDDLSVEEARRLAGAGLVGKSTHSLAQAVAAVEEGADYIGFGPLFATPTKPDYQPIGVREIQEVHRLVRRPIFCIGGIKLPNLGAVVQAGASRVVIVSGILQAAEVGEYCRACRQLLDATPLP